MKLQHITAILATLSVSISACAVLPTATTEPNFPVISPTTEVPLQRALTEADFINQANPSNQFDQRVTVAIVSLDPQGQEVLAPVTAQTKLVSGNILEYRGYITNHSPDRIRSMRVTFDIPNNMELYSTDSLLPQRAFGSANGEKFQPMPIKANISGVLQNLPNQYYKAIQWEIQGLGLNEVAEVKYRLKVK